jgi:hypothetical protein
MIAAPMEHAALLPVCDHIACRLVSVLHTSWLCLSFFGRQAFVVLCSG